MHVYLLVNVLLLGITVALWCQGKLPHTTPAPQNGSCNKGPWVLCLTFYHLARSHLVSFIPKDTLPRALPLTTWKRLLLCSGLADDRKRAGNGWVVFLHLALHLDGHEARLHASVSSLAPFTTAVLGHRRDCKRRRQQRKTFTDAESFRILLHPVTGDEPQLRHAAVSAQSFETRLLTQMVRLPIPTWQAGYLRVDLQQSCNNPATILQQSCNNPAHPISTLNRKSRHAEPTPLSSSEWRQNRCFAPFPNL